jgi:hypothetical protein
MMMSTVSESQREIERERERGREGGRERDVVYVSIY